MRRLISLAAVAAVAGTVVLALPAHAATTYTWTGMGTDHTFGPIRRTGRRTAFQEMATA